MDSRFVISSVRIVIGDWMTSPSSTCSTSTNLLLALRAGDETAWQRFVAVYGPLIASWCRSACQNQEDVLDLSQQVFIKVHAGIGSYSGAAPGASFRAWLLQLTRNTVIDFYRQQRRVPEARGGTDALVRGQAIIDPRVEESTRSLSLGQDQVVRRALEVIRNEFRPRDFDVFLRLVVDQIPVPEVARQFSLKAASVYSIKSRILKRLREELGDGASDPDCA
jgi:RNA polymerase sigma-70 factor, ECF subfamily